MKLTPAKCPSCGAAIEVNKKLEKTICQFCGTTVLVEDAIAKVKVELSGKVEVDGIKSRKSRLDRARKHLRLNEFGDANKILSELVKEDSLDQDAYLEILRMKIQALDYDKFDGTSNRVNDSVHWQILEEALTVEKRIRKIDEDHELDDELNELKPDLDRLRGYLDQEKELHEKTIDSKEKLQEIIRYQVTLPKSNKVIDCKEILKKYFEEDLPSDAYAVVKEISKNGEIIIAYYSGRKTCKSKLTPDEIIEKIDSAYKEYLSFKEQTDKQYKKAVSNRKTMSIISHTLYYISWAIMIAGYLFGIIPGMVYRLIIASWLHPLLEKLF